MGTDFSGDFMNSRVCTNACGAIKNTLTRLKKSQWSLWALALMVGVFNYKASHASTPVVADYELVPPLLAETATPLIMLALSNDHQLFYKAFTDYDDLDGDGSPDTTYKNAIDYEGYFDSYKCYVYDKALEYFKPVLLTATKYCNRAANNQWSGNFLNWASMTRMDEIRKVLFGGKRYMENILTSVTVLERSALPSDAHSFAKYYNGTDLADLTPFGDNTATHPHVPTGLPTQQASGLTLCNVTPDTDPRTNNSKAVNSPPQIRAVAGNYQLWGSNERWQCLYADEKAASNNNNASVTGIYAAANSPSSNKAARQRDGNNYIQYAARVMVCDPTLLGSEDCKQYPNGTHKPVGILQKFGDSGQVKFGLVTGSYKKNKSGGVLRKEVSDIADEIQTTTNGAFVAGAGGIIETINLFRVANYDYRTGVYNDTDNCPWGKASFPDGACTNWGNPFSEILLECYRYFAGKQPQAAFDADDNSVIKGLTRDRNWNPPLNSDNLCAKLNVIAFNASSSSYDSDALQAFSDLNPPAGVTAKTMTKKVGDGEGITGGASTKQYFVGEHGANNNQLCTPKDVTNLGDVLGTCPDAPRLGGSYQMAGMAYHARVNDIRSDLDEDQTVQTYGVSLSPAVPNVVIPVPGSTDKSVKLLPACRSNFRYGGAGNCGLVDFKIVKNYVPTAIPGQYEGAFYVNWEDSEQGGDYDMDMYGMIRYTINAGSITIETDVMHQSTPDAMGFGFVVSGTTEDGFKVMSGINNFSEFGCNRCKSGDSAVSKTFALGSSSAALLEQPLYYAAKWGGFTDLDGNGEPNLTAEWDQRNNATGALGADGTPDTYFFAVNPKQLKTQLTAILVNILERTASGTSAAVVTNTGVGEGALYQALYNPRFAAKNGVDYVSWVGSLNALFLDRYGNIREDNAPPYAELTSADNIIDVFYDPVSLKTKVQRYAINADGTRGLAADGLVEVSDIESIWSAADQLAQVSDYTNQRAFYGNSARTGRYILSAVDQDGDGQIGFDKTLDESIAFVHDYFAPAYMQPWYRLLGLKSSNAEEGPKIVNYIRGESVLGYRNRRVDLDDDGIAEPALLGDIVHSSPTAVGRPASAYDLTFGDDTYRTFRQTYQNRRQMVYVGANDGMVHGFNSGFFDANTSSYALEKNGETEHPLGSELWAYVPYNVLPHLQWLTKPDYPHVYFLDGSIKYYDVNIFPKDKSHPEGWGTILVVGMRFGGGDFTLDPQEDADGDSSDDITLRSAYVVLDITDPERAPVVLAEISHEDMGYTTGEPDLVKMRVANRLTGSYENPEQNEWFLVFGSGPDGNTQAARERALRKGESDKTTKLFVYNLKDRDLNVIDTGQANSFVGGLRSADWNNDYIDDALYFGTVAGTAANPKGKLRRAKLELASGDLRLDISDVLDVNDQPFSATPLTVRDRLGDLWVYAGTGRFFSVEDNFSDAQQSYYGIKEPRAGGTVTGVEVAAADLINTTDIKVFTDGAIESKSDPGAAIYLGGSLTASTTFNDVVNAVQRGAGWYFDFVRDRSRNITQAVVADQSLVFSEYQTSGLKCQPEGFGFLNAPHLQAGIPGVFAPLGTDPNSTHGDNAAEEVLMYNPLGLGSPSTPTIHQRGDGKKVAIVQSSTGELTSTVVKSGITAGARESWKELIIDWD